MEKVVFLSTVESLNYLKRYGKSGLVMDREFQNSRAFCAAQAEEVCLYFAEKYQLKVVMLRLPYAAGRLNRGNFLGCIFWSVYKGERITLPYHPNDRIDFLSLEELSELLVQITEETEDESGVYTAVSGYRYTYADLARMEDTISPKVKIMYEKLPNVAELPDYPKELRRVYGFVPTENVMENIGFCYKTFLRESVRGERRGRAAFLERLSQAGGSLYPYIELLAAFFLTELAAGSVTGYIRNKKADELLFAQKESSLFRDKYLFLNGVYHGAVENKGEYKKQILGFKDSFGKIFDAAQKLNAELSESVFLKWLGVLEDILENRSTHWIPGSGLGGSRCVRAAGFPA
ncbi:MAG: hypothetical protein HFE83_13130 [Lachnospiraceae bacterium]|nr:hypothetical protein [Lachnospiraceae bacterium]